MPSRTTRTLVVATSAALAIGALAGCSSLGHVDTPVATLTTPTGSAPTDAGKKAAAGTITVADQSGPADRAAALSRALFASAPGFVLVPDSTGATTSEQQDTAKTAANAAARLHVPVLVADAGQTTEREAKRLGATWYVPVDDAHDDVHAERMRLSDAPDVPEPHRPSSPAVVVTTDDPADAAIRGTVDAAGATAVELPGGTSSVADAPHVIDDLRSARHGATVLLGERFADDPDPDYSVRAARTGWQLPGGGQRPFDGHRYVALYGVPGTPVLGALGEQDPAASVQRVQALADQYTPLSDEPVVPSLEIIATVAAGAPGDDGNYSNELPVDRLEPYVDAATEAHMPVILDLQPGRSDFLSQAKQYASLLERPGVGLALDPEWRLGPDQVPLKQIGSVSADEVNRTAAWLADLVDRNDLPPKMFVLHEFRAAMLQDPAAIDVDLPQLDPLVHVDGQGAQPDKQATWNALHQGAPKGVAWGWKNFFDEDAPMLTPEQTMQQVSPTPDLITYQ
ncbi:hypothetical protein [Curtobacterium sp. Leaf261]|uniref:hypothetical protein n=1 Tax=Curtobacterium sp. Leaf261 TaxID=1736311 RepID=UPI0006F75323|nr:hypothetical protein [Curtobacterium sp. Leaf261]KQO65213.1 hypothetical protein ASF23_03645 [Curtobacterium sp. Leaf261]